MTFSEFQGRTYTPVAPQADSEALSLLGNRLILRHRVWEEPQIFIAPKGVIHSGWVIGEMTTPENEEK